MPASLFKQKVYEACLIRLNQRILECNAEIMELAAGIENDAKSSSGDKHETARAMMQQEQEKLGWQLKELNSQMEVLFRIDVKITSLKVIPGSLLNTNKGFLFLSVAIGKIIVEGNSVIVLSSQSPLGLKLKGLKVGESAELHSIRYLIEEVT